MAANAREAIAKVLIIEDNAPYAQELARAFGLAHKGLRFDVGIVASESEAESFLRKDEIDIYIVDLELPELKAAPSEKVGERLVKKLVETTSGGVIVHTGILRNDREDFLWAGVDDYIQKGDKVSEVVAKAFAVWRRVRSASNAVVARRKHARAFQLGNWRFDGSRNLTGNQGEKLRLSPTELAFIQYLCTVDTEIDRREFNVAVLGRAEYEEDKRIDNLVYRIREKLGDTFQLISRHNGGTYKLINVVEIPHE